MTKVFVAQTHEKDRTLVTDFLKATNHDVRPFSTDAMSLIWLTRDMMFSTQPFVVVTSQRDSFGCDFISNKIHTAAFCMMPKTLTIVYSWSLAHQESIQGMVRYLSDLNNVPRHQLRFVPKIAEDTREEEHQTILKYINEFERDLHVA